MKTDAERDALLQDIYARWLDFGAKAGFVLSLAALALYLSGLLAPVTPLAELTRLWALPVGRYVEMAGAPTGWGWVRLVGHGDYLNMVGIALFATVTMACYLRLLAALLAQGDRLYALIAALQVAVLAVAAAGIFVAS